MDSPKHVIRLLAEAIAFAVILAAAAWMVGAPWWAVLAPPFIVFLVLVAGCAAILSAAEAAKAEQGDKAR